MRTLASLRPHTPRRRRAALALAALLGSLLATAPLGSTATAASPLVSQGKPATASSVENAGTPVAGVNDGNTGTRWAST